MGSNHRLQKYIDNGTLTSQETQDFMNLLAGGPLTLSRAIKSHRKCADWSQSEFADRLKVSKQAVSKFETGGLLPSIETVIKISEIFEVDRSSFIRLLFEEISRRAGCDYSIRIEQKSKAC